MKELDAAEKILSSMLEKLGFQASVEQEPNEETHSLNIISEEKKILIGKGGDRLEDLQYLTNRILQKHYPKFPRVRVDCDHYRANQEHQLMESTQEIAKQVIEDGKPRKLKPLNAYYRRIAHNALLELGGVTTSSPKGNARYKRIEVQKA